MLITCEGGRTCHPASEPRDSKDFQPWLHWVNVVGPRKSANVCARLALCMALPDLLQNLPELLYQ